MENECKRSVVVAGVEVKDSDSLARRVVKLTDILTKLSASDIKLSLSSDGEILTLSFKEVD